MTNAELKAIVQREEYDFLHTNKHLGSNILFLTLSGSHAYGTNVEGSDIDIRGVAGSPEILGFNRFEQAIDNRTDTVIYAVNKFVGLLAQGNPSIIELLGNDPELYVNMTPEGQMLLDNRELFLTRRIAYSYGGFANDQLRRLQMGLLRNGASPEAFKNKFEKRSLERAIAGWRKDNIFEITISEDADEEGKHPLLISGSLNDYPVTSLKSLLKSLTTTIDQYEQPQHPKAQKDAAHINKHAMHIVRLYYTAFDILEKGEIITRRDKEREELLAIRNGKYLREDGSYAPEFFELVDESHCRIYDFMSGVATLKSVTELRTHWDGMVAQGIQPISAVMYCNKRGPMLKHTCDEMNTLVQAMNDEDFYMTLEAAGGDVSKMPHYSFDVVLDQNIPVKK